jgi:hypothetical protein
MKFRNYFHLFRRKYKYLPPLRQWRIFGGWGVSWPQPTLPE